MEKHSFEKMTLENLKTILFQGLSEKLESVFGSMFYPDESTCEKQGDFEDFVNVAHRDRIRYKWEISKELGSLPVRFAIR